jgi:hypothetical protein
MSKKLRKKEQEMLASWPADDAKQTHEIPPTEPRPTLLNFEPTPATIKNTENIANINETTPIRSAHTAPLDKTTAHAPLHSALPIPQANAVNPKDTFTSNSHYETPSYLHTATSSNELGMDTIIDTVLASYVCPDELLGPKIKSFFDVLTQYTKNHPDSAISPDTCSEGSRTEFNAYYHHFKSRNRHLAEPATVALLSKITEVSPAARLIVQKAWMRGVGLSAADSYGLAAHIKSFGAEGMGDRQATYEDLGRINFDGLAAITIEALCGAGANSSATDRALDNLATMDVHACRDLAQVLAMELGYWQAAYRELDDAPMATYLRLKNLKAACSRDHVWSDIIDAFDDITARDKTIKISKVKRWSTIEAKLGEAWRLACNQGMLERFDEDPAAYRQIAGNDNENNGIEKSAKSSGSTDNLSVGFGQHSKPVATRDAADLKDHQLPCKGCKKPFTDSKEDQTHRMARGWLHPPARCPPCKATYLEALSKNPQHCNDFKSGNCAYGDKCRYSHSLPLVSMHIAIDDESSDDIDLDCY